MLKRTEPSPVSTGALLLLNRSGKHIYGGTVDPVTVRERRVKNKAARKSRRINRRAK
jgi:hypothetical protein